MKMHANDVHQEVLQKKKKSILNIENAFDLNLKP